jgi:hypothetical protein
MIITDHIHSFREAARHLWNAYLREGSDWKTLENFEQICGLLFEEIVTNKIDVDYELNNICSYAGEYAPEYQVFADHTGKLSLMVNRELKASGYWDHPVTWIPPEIPNDLRLIEFFDFDQLGWRTFEYYRVRIITCESHPEIEGRDALIRCHNADVRILAPEPSAVVTLVDRRGGR